MKKILAIASAAMLTLTLLAGCGNNNSLQAIKNKGEITMLTNAAFPPFEYLDNGTVAGVDADVAAEIAKDLGVKLKITDMDFGLLIDSVKSGKGDFAAAGMTVKPERLEKVDFSKEYVKSSQYLIVRSDSDITKEKLDGLVIGVQESTTGDIFASEEVKAKEVKKYKNGLEAVSDLKNNRVDCVIIDKLPAESFVKNSNGALKISGGSLTDESYAIAVKKGNKELLDAINKTIDRLISEGKIDGYVTKHMAK